MKNKLRVAVSPLTNNIDIADPEKYLLICKLSEIAQDILSFIEVEVPDGMPSIVPDNYLSAADALGHILTTNEYDSFKEGS